MVTYFRKQPYCGCRSKWEARMLTAVQGYALSYTKHIKYYSTRSDRILATYLKFGGIFTDFLHKQLGIEPLFIEKCDCSTFFWILSARTSKIYPTLYCTMYKSHISLNYKMNYLWVHTVWTNISLKLTLPYNKGLGQVKHWLHVRTDW